MAVHSQVATLASQSASAYSDGAFVAGDIRVGTNSQFPDGHSVIRYPNVTIERFAAIASASIRLGLKVNATTGTAPNVRLRLSAEVNPAMPSTNAGVRTFTKTVASTVITIPLNTPLGTLYDLDCTAALQEIVNKAGWNSGQAIMVSLLADPGSGRRVDFYDGADTTQDPTITVNYTNPVPVSAEATLTFPPLQILAEVQVGNGPITAEATLTFPALQILAEAQIFIPVPVSAQGVLLFPPLEIIAEAGVGDPKKNTLFSFERPHFESHHIVTEAGDVYGFASTYDTTLGGVRDAMMGQADDAWTPEAGTRRRVPASLPISATLPERAHPRRDGDVLERELPFIREIHHPDGRILDVTDILLRGRPAPDRLELTARPEGALLRDPLLSGTQQAVFLTEDSTPELPVFAVDAGGGITAPLLAKRVDRGALAFAVRLEERGMLPLASVGRPVEGDGSSDSTSITMSYQNKHLHVSVRGVLTRIREAQLGPFGLELALWLYWSKSRAHLVSSSAIGVRTFKLPAGPPVDLSERRLTAGIDANEIGLGAFLAPGSASLGTPFFSFKTPRESEAKTKLKNYFDEFATPGRSWTIIPPDYALEISRVDAKALELAPGDNLVLDFAVARIGDYTGLINPTITVGEGLYASWILLSQTPTVDTFRVTVESPTGTAEGTYTFRFAAAAAGADVPGSVLVDVRDAFDSTLEVAATPAIMPNATFVRLALDLVKQRPSEILKDSSANANVFFWHDTARPDRLGRGFLATGVGASAVSSGALTNSAQAQRMNGDATYCAIITEVALMKVGGVIFQLAADGGENGVRVRREQGGFTLQTVNGATVVTSPDVLPYTGADAELECFVTTTDVILVNRVTGRRITLTRPAWADAAVRVATGAIKNAGGSFTNVTRVHVLADTLHPYALSASQANRNLDALKAFCPAGDGKPEYPDNMLALFQFNETTAELPSEKLRNKAAPALGLTLSAVGAVSYPNGAVATPGGTTAYLTTENVFALANTLSVVVTLEALNTGAPFNAAVSVASSGPVGAAVEVGSGNGGKPVLRHQSGGTSGDAVWNQRDLPNTPVSFLHTLLLEVSGNGAASKLQSLDTNQVVTRTGTAMSGQLNVTLGALLRSNGAVNEGQKMKATELIVCRGAMTAQQLSDVRTLMRT